MPPGLICRKQALPVRRRIERVPSDEHYPRLLVVKQAQQKIGEAEDRSGATVAFASDRFWERMVGAMRERIAVDYQQGLLGGFLIARRHNLLALVSGHQSRRFGQST